MAMKVCEKCDESVDEAKAFCPACGNAFVIEEKREDSSEFDKYAGTMNMSQSVYKMMLSEMQTKPVVSEEYSVIKPIAPVPAVQVKEEPVEPGKSSNWLIYVLIAGVILIIFLLALGALLIYLLAGRLAF